MFGRSIGPGDDVEAWCTRCRMILNHRVIAVVGSSIQKVQCLTCGGEHKYYPSKGTQKQAKGRPVSSPFTSKFTKASADKTTKAESEWATFMKEMPPETIPRPYKITDTYAAAEYINHPTFGLGRILEIVGAEKMHVIFKSGRKILLFNRKN